MVEQLDAVDAAASGAVFGPRSLALITGGGAWSVAQWMTVFSTAYLVNVRTSSPLVTELTGVAFFAPMLLAGGLTGVISDSGDRARICFDALLLLAAGSLVLGLGALTVWRPLYLPLLFAYIVAVGLSLAVNSAARRVLLAEMVPPTGVTRALAADAIAMNGGNLLGPLVGGLALGGAASSRSFVVLGFFFGAAAILVSPVVVTRSRDRQSSARDGRLDAPRSHHRPEESEPARASPGNVLEQMRTLVHDSPSLAGVVAVTAVMNFCYFPLFSTIPLLADRFHIGAAQLGVLGACPGVGMMSSAAIASWRTPRRPARTYLAGCLLAFLGLLAASQANTVSTTALALLVSGLGAGLFAAFQASLVIRSVRSELRGRAMGVMNTAIGCMTGGLLLGGYIASAYGVSTAIAILALVGLTALSGCSTAWWHVWTSM